MLVASCRQKYSADIELSLIDAGDNATELIKVLKHYEIIDRDTLKFQAACFLIENMRLHFSLDTSTIVNNLVIKSYDKIDSLTYHTFFKDLDSSQFELANFLHQRLDTDEFTPTPNYIDSLVKNEYRRADFTSENFNRIRLFESESNKIFNSLSSTKTELNEGRYPSEDLSTMKSDWLIDHIDNAFVVWKKSKYARALSFYEFKNYILPYRCLYEFPSMKSGAIRNKLEKVIINGEGDIAAAIKRLNFYMYCVDVFEDRGSKLGNLGFYDILQFYKYDCDRHSEWTVRALNACGVPAVLEFTSGFFNRNKLHYGVSVLDTNGKLKHFTPKWQNLGDTAHSSMFSKVFRRTFAPRESPYTLKRENEEVPFIFGDPFIEDVTDHYHKVVDVTVPYLELGDSRGSIPYLSIFTPTGWRPIGWGKIDEAKKYIRFEKVPVGACYIAGTYRSEKVKPISKLFQVQQNGSVRFYESSSSEKQSMTLNRKYPLKPALVRLMAELVGAKIQGSADSTFSEYTDIYILTKKDVDNFLTEPIRPTRKQKFRYWRLIGAGGKPVNVAELEFYTKSELSVARTDAPPFLASSKKSIRSSRNLFKTIKGKPLFNGQGVERAFDLEEESYVNAHSIAVDFSTKIFIDEIRILPRNANNGIVPGNTYELFYFDKQWKSLGRQQPTSDVLYYPSVPRNAVFWLKNHSGGREEQIFVYENRKQIFLNSEDLSVINHVR